MSKKGKIFLSWSAAAIVLFVNTAALAAEKWPERPIRLVVGYAPGGATDVIARAVAKGLTDSMGQTVIVENKPGANSNIAADQVARATPDGYTLLFGTISTATNASVYHAKDYNMEKDLTPVAPIAMVPNILVVNAKSPIKSVQDYVAYAKAHPGELTFASAGTGSSIHLSGELFKKAAGVDMLHIPYRGSGPAMTDLLAGTVMSSFDNLPSALPHIQAGSLRALGVTSNKRDPHLPDVQTIEEQGITGYNAYAWFGLFAPAGVSDGIVKIINTHIKQILGTAEFQAQLENLGGQDMYMPQSEFRVFVLNEVKKWGAVIDDVGLRQPSQ